MSELFNKIKEDNQNALRSGDKELRSFLQGIQDDVTKIGINDIKHPKRAATDEDAVKVLRGHVAICQENIKILEGSDRLVDINKYRNQMQSCIGYLPADISDSDIASAVVELVGDSVKSVKLLGKIIPALKVKFGADLDPSKASAIAKRVLSS